MYAYKPQKLKTFMPHLINLKQTDLPSPNNYQKVIETIKKLSATKQYSETSIQMIRKWLDLAAPTLNEHSSKLFNNLQMDQVYNLCSAVKFHRQNIVNITQKHVDSKHMAKLNWPSIMKTYQYFIVMKHTSNVNFMNRLRAEVVSRIKKPQNNQLSFKNMLNFLILMQLTLLDSNLKRVDKLKVIQQMSSVFLNSLTFFQEQSTHQYYYTICKNIFQLLKLQNITLNEKLMAVFENIHQNLEQIIQKNVRHHVPQTESHKQIFNSVFEKIFQTRLSECGFQYDSNFFVKGNEYDIIVRARKYKKNYPFQNINIRQDDLSQLPEIPMQIIKQISNSRSIELLESYKKLDKEVVLDLNGPIHYIDSDVLPEKSVTRLQQFKIEKLTLYGINKHNAIDFTEWQNANKYLKLSEKFINQKIMNPKTIKVQSQ